MLTLFFKNSIFFIVNLDNLYAVLTKLKILFEFMNNDDFFIEEKVQIF